MNKFEKQIYAEINGEDVYYSKIKSRLKVTSILTILALSSILSEKYYNHTKGISPIAKILDIVKLPNNELSLGNIIQLKGMENDLKKENINSNSYYYDYVILRDEIKVSKEDAINFKSDKNYRLIEKEVKLKFDGVDLFLEDLMVDKNYSLVSEKRIDDVYVIDYNNDSCDNIYLTNDGYNYISGYYYKKDGINYSVADKSIKKVLSKRGK